MQYFTRSVLTHKKTPHTASQAVVPQGTAPTHLHYGYVNEIQ